MVIFAKIVKLRYNRKSKNISRKNEKFRENNQGGK